MTRLRDRLGVDIGPEDLDPQRQAQLRQTLAHQDADGVGLLAGGAARHPDAHAVVLARGREELRQHLQAEVLEGRRVAEERGDADEQVLGEKLGLLRVLAEEVEVLVERGRAAELDPVAQTAQHRATLVVAEVVARLALEDGADPVERGGELVVGERLRAGKQRRLRGSLDPPASLRDVARAFEQPCRHLANGHGLMHGSGRDGGLWHGVVLRGLRVLGESEPAMLLDSLQADGAVRARTGEKDSDGPLASVLGEGAQEDIDQPAPLTLDGDHPEGAAGDAEGGAGRDDVDVIGLGRHPVLGLDDGHGRAPSEKLRQHAGVLGREMLHHHEGEAAVLGHVGKELLESLQATRRCADAHDQRSPLRVLCVVGAHRSPAFRRADLPPGAGPVRSESMGRGVSRRRSVGQRAVRRDAALRTHGTPLSLCSPQAASCEMHEARAPEPHRDREQAGDRDDAPACAAHPGEAEVDENRAQGDPKHAAEGPLHDFEELFHDAFSVDE